MFLHNFVPIAVLKPVLFFICKSYCFFFRLEECELHLFCQSYFCRPFYKDFWSEIALWVTMQIKQESANRVPIWHLPSRWISKFCALSRVEARFWNPRFVFTRSRNTSLVGKWSNNPTRPRRPKHTSCYYCIGLTLCYYHPWFDLVFEPDYRVFFE